MNTEAPKTDMDKHIDAILNKTEATPPATPPVTPPGEQPKETTPVTPSGDTEEQKILAEYQKEAFKAPEAPKEEEPDLTGLDKKYVDYITKLKNQKPEVKNEIPSDVQEKLGKAEKIFGNKLVNELAEFLTGEGDIEEKINSLFVRNEKDYSKVSNDEVLTEYFKGLYGDDNAKITQAIKDFKEVNTRAFQIDENINKMRATLTAKNPNKLSDKFQELITKNLGTVKQQQSEATKEREKLNTVYQESISAVDKKIKELKEFNGIPISDADKKELIETATYHMPLNRNGKDVSIDYQKGIDFALKLKYFDESVKQSRLQGFSDAMKKFYRPNANNSANVSGAGDGSGKSTMAEQAQKEYLNKQQLEYKL